VLEERAQDQVGVRTLDGARHGGGRLERRGKLDTDVMPLLPQGTPDPLGETVEG
jgi:hypothetical protein